MKIDTDRLLRGVWLINGVILLLFLLATGVMVVTGFIANLGADEAAVRVASRPAPPRQPRAVRYSPPRAIPGTAARLALVHHGEAWEQGAGISGGGRPAGPVVNVIFLDEAGGRLLLDRPGYIGRVMAPPEVRATTTGPDDPILPNDSGPRDWIGYEMALDDANGDGVLDARDPVAFYVSGLDGRGLRRVLPAGLRYREAAPLGTGRVLVTALEEGEKGGAEARLRQRAFIYDVAAARLSPYAALDSAAARAGRLLGR